MYPNQNLTNAHSRTILSPETETLSTLLHCEESAHSVWKTKTNIPENSKRLFLYTSSRGSARFFSVFIRIRCSFGQFCRLRAYKCLAREFVFRGFLWLWNWLGRDDTSFEWSVNWPCIRFYGWTKEDTATNMYLNMFHIRFAGTTNGPIHLFGSNERRFLF